MQGLILCRFKFKHISYLGTTIYYKLINISSRFISQISFTDIKANRKREYEIRQLQSYPRILQLARETVSIQKLQWNRARFIVNRHITMKLRNEKSSHTMPGYTRFAAVHVEIDPA